MDAGEERSRERDSELCSQDLVDRADLERSDLRGARGALTQRIGEARR